MICPCRDALCWLGVNLPVPAITHGPPSRHLARFRAGLPCAVHFTPPKPSQTPDMNYSHSPLAHRDNVQLCSRLRKRAGVLHIQYAAEYAGANQVLLCLGLPVITLFNQDIGTDGKALIPNANFPFSNVGSFYLSAPLHYKCHDNDDNPSPNLIFFLKCPPSLPCGARLHRLPQSLAAIAHSHPSRVCVCHPCSSAP